ncbi:MAG: undecaprenyl-diphosphate phosphatase [Opitutales bacterium]
MGSLVLAIDLSAHAGDGNATSLGAGGPILDYRDALIYGVVEGVTEYLPVSSTGHLILVKQWFGNEGSDEAGKALNAYLIVIQFGAILAVALLYWRELWAIILGLVGMSPRGRLLARNLLIAFFPAALLGFFLDELIDDWLMDDARPVAMALLAGAFLMFAAERMRRKREIKEVLAPSVDLSHMKPGSALFIGVLQCVAMWPGTSRSMMTIVGGYFVGLGPAKAAEFSFLLGLVTLTAAAGYKVVTKGDEMSEHLELGPVLVGCLVAGVAAALAVRWLVGYLTRRGLGLFAWYRLVLGVVVLFWI